MTQSIEDLINIMLGAIPKEKLADAAKDLSEKMEAEYKHILEEKDADKLASHVETFYLFANMRLRYQNALDAKTETPKEETTGKSPLDGLLGIIFGADTDTDTPESDGLDALIDKFFGDKRF